MPHVTLRLTIMGRPYPHPIRPARALEDRAYEDDHPEERGRHDDVRPPHREHAPCLVCGAPGCAARCLDEEDDITW